MAENPNQREWPAFITADLGDSDADWVEMNRRWTVYRDEMAVLIAAGGVHMDEDSWWVDDVTGELIGPDPELERPWTEEDFARARPAAEVLGPEIAAAMARKLTRPREGDAPA